MKFISSPEDLSSTFTFTVACTIHFFFSFILFTFTSFPLDFVSLNKLNSLLLELKMIIFGNYSLSLMRNKGKEGVSCFSGRSEINDRKEKNRNIFGRERVSK